MRTRRPSHGCGIIVTKIGVSCIYHRTQSLELPRRLLGTYFGMAEHESGSDDSDVFGSNEAAMDAALADEAAQGRPVRGAAAATLDKIKHSVHMQSLPDHMDTQAHEDESRSGPPIEPGDIKAPSGSKVVRKQSATPKRARVDAHDVGASSAADAARAVPHEPDVSPTTFRRGRDRTDLRSQAARATSLD